MIKKYLLRATLFSFILLMSTPCMAHKIRVFAYESNGQIVSEAKFNSGRPVRNSAAAVEKEDGTILIKGSTDEKGVFRFDIPAAASSSNLNLRVVVDTGDGHKGSWLIEAADYLDIQPQSAAALSKNKPALTQIPPDYSRNSILECEAVEENIRLLLEKELAPIKRTLAEVKDRKPSLQDILGALGYIFGLAGIAAYVKFKRDGDKT